MPLSGNKGEGSEIYALFRLLGEGVVYAGDEHLNQLQELFYPIIIILRQEKEGSFNYELCDKNVIIQQAGDNETKELLRIPCSDFLIEAEALLKEIKENRGAFSLPMIEAFMKKVHCSSLKAKASDKTDIKIILHDRRTKINSEMGFSIKSQLGGDSTLLNASQATNFNFKIEGGEFSDDEINRINSLETKHKVLDRVNAIKEKGGRFVFDMVDNKIFYENLMMLDGHLPIIIAYLLLEQLNTSDSKLKDLVKKVSEINPLQFNPERVFSIYAYKVKNLLTSVALGLMPNKAWDGRYDANGGYMVIKESGDILCYHFYDRNRFEDYLFSNVYLERSSTSRHKYATIIKDAKGKLIFKLNLQVRLK